MAEALTLSSGSCETHRTIRPKPAAIALLSEIIARLHGVDMPVVQFINVSEEASASDVTTSFAHASAACLGKTLLVRLRHDDSRDERRTMVVPQTTTVSRRRSRKAVADTIEIVPDSRVPGLCHAYLGRELTEPSSMAFGASENWLDGVILDFKLIIIESDSPERCPAALDLATRCHGSVLVITAGMTSLSQSRIVMRQVQLAGGTLMGSVLRDADSMPRLSIASCFYKQIRKSR